MGHRSVITASIFILGITLCDFHLWKSVIHTTHRFAWFYCILCLRERGRTEHSEKKTQAEINIYSDRPICTKSAFLPRILHTSAGTYTISNADAAARIYLKLKNPQWNCPNWQRMNCAMYAYSQISIKIKMYIYIYIYIIKAFIDTLSKCKNKNPNQKKIIWFFIWTIQLCLSKPTNQISVLAAYR